MPFTQRSEATRTSILTAARTLLAERGFEATTIRAVAARAGIDPSMVMRYYGSKDGLFRASVELDLRLDLVPREPLDGVGAALARHFLSRWEGDLADEAITLLLRSAGTTPMAAEQLRTIFDEQVAGFVGGVIPGDRAEAVHRAGLVSTQLLGLALTRYVLELPPVVAMDAGTVVASVGPVLQHHLTGAVAEPTPVR
ncbi:TetR family transcriptional regulator [Jiangella asiatica]|uniref:TetR/AcrR family transcriptional regulator n=1 Tax=Jiangella asiatica TaxID=2530372 RepID=UPI00193E3FCF|nr:TetR family transcriptional regulator [Jiangella asiatica]